MRKIFLYISLALVLIVNSSFVPNYTINIALLKYNGGGDWYANPTSLSNLIKFCNTNIGTSINPDYSTVDVGSQDIFNYPFVHLTGHGNIILSATDVDNLRTYLIGGGFLHIDDNYGLDKFVRRELKKLFPESELTELPASHQIYHQKYSFNNGLPKIHEHDNKSSQGFAIYYKGRMVVYYTYEADLGDGWEDASVHKDSEPTRLKALQMGANIIQYAFQN